MLGLKTSSRRANKDEAEKPFWISFSDMMTALMVLFLVAMAVALLAVTAPAVKGNNQRKSTHCRYSIVPQRSAGGHPGVSRGGAAAAVD